MTKIMKRAVFMRLLTLVVSVAMITLGGGVMATTATAAPPPTAGNQNTVNVHGTGPNGQQFNGKFTASSAKVSSTDPTKPAVVGQLTGTLTSPGPGQSIPGGTGPGAQQVSQQVEMPVNNLAATCQVLNLTLGPVDVNLLGLMVHLDQVVLNITANPSGGVLGQLLCSLAGATGGPLDQIVNLLNQILSAL